MVLFYTSCISYRCVSLRLEKEDTHNKPFPVQILNVLARRGRHVDVSDLLVCGKDGVRADTDSVMVKEGISWIRTVLKSGWRGGYEHSMRLPSAGNGTYINTALGMGAGQPARQTRSTKGS